MALTDSIVCWLSLNGASNSTRIDSSGNGNDFLSNGSIPAVGGIMGYAASFDGSTGNNLSNATQIIPDGDFSVSLWVKFTVISGDCDIWGQGVSGTSYQYVGIRHNARFTGITFDVNGAVPIDISLTTISAGVWNHFVGVYDSATMSSKNYVNGIYIGPLSHTFATVPGFTNSIGSAPGGSANNMNGAVDLFGLWTRKLTDGSVSPSSPAGGEVAQLYNSGFGYDPYNPFRASFAAGSTGFILGAG